MCGYNNRHRYYLERGTLYRKNPSKNYPKRRIDEIDAGKHLRIFRLFFIFFIF